MSRDSFLKRTGHKNYGTSSHRRAPKQEMELAARFGGQTVPGSGSGPQKGDVKKAYGCLRIEAKTTKNKSFSVTRAMIDKIEQAALSTNEMPVIVIEFIDDQGNPLKEVAVVPTYMLEGIADGIKG